MYRGFQRYAFPSLKPLVQGDPVRRPVGGEDLADQVLAWHRAPHARVARGVPVVAHHEVVPGRHLGGTVTLHGDAPVLLDVGLLQALAVDVDIAVAAEQPQLDRVARQPDQALDERPTCTALDSRERRRLEDDDLT